MNDWIQRARILCLKMPRDKMSFDIFRLILAKELGVTVDKLNEVMLEMSHNRFIEVYSSAYVILQHASDMPVSNWLNNKCMK